MHRPALVLAAVVGAGGCGTTEDPRPATLAYITETILIPHCANAQCHSAFTEAGNLRLDTLEVARREVLPLIDVYAVPPEVSSTGAAGDPTRSLLYSVLVRSIDRMPYDQPLPEADIALIARWIEEGAPGAQCAPAAGPACGGSYLYACREDYNLEVVEDCAARTPTAPNFEWRCLRTAGGCVEVCAGTLDEQTMECLP